MAAARYATLSASRVHLRRGFAPIEIECAIGEIERLNVVVPIDVRTELGNGVALRAPQLPH